MGTNDKQQSSLMATLLDKRQKRLLVFTFAWLVTCFGGALFLFVTIDHSLGEYALWFYAGLSYFLVLPLVLCIDASLFGLSNERSQGVSNLRYTLSAVSMALLVCLYPLWARLFFAALKHF